MSTPPRRVIHATHAQVEARQQQRDLDDAAYRKAYGEPEPAPAARPVIRNLNREARLRREAATTTSQAAGTRAAAPQPPSPPPAPPAPTLPPGSMIVSAEELAVIDTVVQFYLDHAPKG